MTKKMKRSPFLTTFDSDDEEETDLSSPEIEVDLRHISQFQVKVKGTHREIGKKQVYVSQKLSDVVNRLGSSESSTTHTFLITFQQQISSFSPTPTTTTTLTTQTTTNCQAAGKAPIGARKMAKCFPIF